MAPHSTEKELDHAAALSAKGKTPGEIHETLRGARGKRGLVGPDLTTVRRALRGLTRRRGRKETRGAKTKLTAGWLAGWLASSIPIQRLPFAIHLRFICDSFAIPFAIHFSSVLFICELVLI